MKNLQSKPIAHLITSIGIIALAMIFLYFYAGIAQKEKLAAANKDRTQQLIDAKKNIILITIPKSGGIYILKTLALSLGYKNVNLAPGYFPHDTIIYDQLNDFYQHRSLISQDHLDPSPVNTQILQLFTDRYVVHFRDPRQVLLSFTHYTSDLNSRAEKHNLYHLVPYPPPEYFNWNLSEQIDWNIENHLPHIVHWMQGWIAYKQQQEQSPSGEKILFTTYDEFVRDEKAFYNRILDFYGIAHEQFHLKTVAKDKSVHFRKGDVNEWKSVFTPDQKAKIAQIVPQDLLQYFGWQ